MRSSPKTPLLTECTSSRLWKTQVLVPTFPRPLPLSLPCVKLRLSLLGEPVLPVLARLQCLQLVPAR